MTYTDDNMLMLSGVQHFVYCPRQWALSYIDMDWADNILTTEGHILHQKVDDPTTRQLLNDRITIRSLRIASAELGLYGITDAVELIPVDDDTQPGITHPRYHGRYMPYPIEYKRGHHKPDLSDTMQVVCQVICLEEMYGIQIPRAALFYWEVRRREEIIITDILRENARKIAAQMHTIFDSGQLPPADNGPKCRRCSLRDICMPQLQNTPDVHSYLRRNLYEETP